jgi:hypothetical protein
VNDSTIPIFFFFFHYKDLIANMYMSLGTQIHTSRMTLADDVNLEEFVMTIDEFSGLISKQSVLRLVCLHLESAV